ncbi:MAG: hypothetical protein PHU69_06495 [Fermentimonas sp.]|nr:hypothetical protein [Fermentimonas sp.]
MDNLFFDIGKLKKCGNNVIIGKTVRIRYPELVEIGDNVIIDDFTYISTELRLHSYVHISAGCKLIGGKLSMIEMYDFATLSPNVVLVAGSDDYRSGMAGPFVSMEYKAQAEIGSIFINKHCIVGAGSVVLPNSILEEGSAVGALSLVKGILERYTLYAGVPARIIGQRDEQEIDRLEKEFLHDHI